MAVQPGLCRTWSEDRFSQNEAQLILQQRSRQEVQQRMVLVVIFSYFIKLLIFCFDVAMCPSTRCGGYILSSLTAN